ncbi:MAG: replicative DNA helicase [Endomicrobiia bacterium]
MSDNIIDRVPPNSIEAEIAVLGSMLIDKEALVIALEKLTKDDFYKDAHSIIFETIKNMHLKNVAVDFVTLTEELKKMKVIDRIGGAGYITSLVELVTTSANVEHYIKVVSEKSLLRKMIKIGTTIIEESYSDHKSVNDILNISEENIFRLSRERDRKGFLSVDRVVDETLDKIQKLHRHEQDLGIVPTGYKILDERLAGGLHKSNFVIIAGRPGMGKTSFSMNIVANAAIRNKIPVGIFSLEMSATELMFRMLCSEAKRDLHMIRKGILSKDDWARLTTVAGMISESPMFIDDSSDLNVLELRTRARRLAHELTVQNRRLGMIVIDYIQRMRGINPRDSRQQEIADISNSLKSLARELDIPVVGLSQLSRKPEDKERDKQPKLSDLRESGALEQDADVVMFIYHPPEKGVDDGNNEVVLGISKHRNGPTGKMRMMFIKEYTTFNEIDWSEQE